MIEMYSSLKEGVTEIVSINEGMRDLRIKYVDSGKITQDTLNALAAIDPTKTKKYTEWMIVRLLNEVGDKEKHEGTNFKELFKNVPWFSRIVDKRAIENIDISRYPTIEALNTAVETSKEKVYSDEEHVQYGTDVVLDNDKVTVYHIKTEGASISLGKQYDPETEPTKQIPCIFWPNDSNRKCRFKDEGSAKNANLFLIVPKGEYRKKYRRWVVQVLWEYVNREWKLKYIFWDWDDQSHNVNDPKVQEMVQELGISFE